MVKRETASAFSSCQEGYNIEQFFHEKLVANNTELNDLRKNCLFEKIEVLLKRK